MQWLRDQYTTDETQRAQITGVPVTAVRYQGIIHDFVMVDALRDTPSSSGTRPGDAATG